MIAALRERIGANEWQPGEALPSVAVLAGQYGVSRGTVARTLAMLADEGLVEVVPRWGTFRVNEPQAGAEPERLAARADLTPWDIAPEHDRDPLRYMLRAESRARQGVKLSEPDERLVSLLHDLLNGRYGQWVIDYDRENGFALRPRTEADLDIIREPRRLQAGDAISPSG